jgi:NADH:ubiquinone oxidoreductase subunit 2 (subunit N)
MIVGIVAIQILTNNEYYTNIIPTIFIYFFTYILTMLGIIYILNMYKILFINNKYVNLNYINNYNNINTMLKFQEINKIEDLCGSIKKDKVISTLLVIFLTSALGLPPTVLFYTKFSILTFLTNNNYI